MLKAVRAALAYLLLLSLSAAALAGDRLLATGGVMNLEGSAGGGLTPWALIAGLGQEEALRRGKAYAEAGADGVLTYFALDAARILRAQK